MVRQAINVLDGKHGDGVQEDDGGMQEGAQGYEMHGGIHDGSRHEEGVQGDDGVKEDDGGMHEGEKGG